MIRAPAAVLLVEDDHNDVILVKRALQMAGIVCQLHVVATGEDSIAYLAGEAEHADRSKSPLPSLVLVDLTLPGKSGHEVLEWMAQQKWLNHVTRVVLTGSQNPDDMQKSLQSGAHGYLLKPISAAQFTSPGRNIYNILMGANAPTPGPTPAWPEEKAK